MTTLRQAAQQALEAYDAHDPMTVVMEHLRAALAEPERKPLTEEEIYSLFRTVASPVMFARAVERAHGIGEQK